MQLHSYSAITFFEKYFKLSGNLDQKIQFSFFIIFMRETGQDISGKFTKKQNKFVSAKVGISFNKKSKVM